MMQNKTYVLGVTGTIGSGKSTFCRVLSEEFHFPIVDADALSRQAVAKGSKGLKRIKKYFGASFITPEGELDRKKMAACIFANQDKKAELESIVHPFVIDEMLKARERHAKQQVPFMIFECPLLFEKHLETLVDFSVLVVADEKSIIERLQKNRQMQYEDIALRLQNQMNVHEKIKKSDFIIFNDADEQTLRFRARELFEALHVRIACVQAQQEF